MVASKKLSSDLESLIFRCFPQNVASSKSGRKMPDGHGKSRNGHGKVMDKYSVKSVGALIKKKQNSYIMCIDLVRLLLGDHHMKNTWLSADINAKFTCKFSI